MFCLGVAYYYPPRKKHRQNQNMPCSTVSMDLYWNGVATPLFLFVLGNGMVALFNMSTLTGTPVSRGIVGLPGNAR